MDFVGFDTTWIACCNQKRPSTSLLDTVSLYMSCQHAESRWVAKKYKYKLIYRQIISKQRK